MTKDQFIFEAWRTIPSARDYEVSCTGNVRRKTPARGTFVGKILTLLKNEWGYQKVDITINGKRMGKYVHSLVAEAFIGKRPAGDIEINHKDGNKEHNHYTNLEYCTPSENEKHAYAIGLRTPREQNGKNNPNWRGGKKTFACDACGKSFQRYASEYTRSGRGPVKRKMCSQKCRRKGDAVADFLGWEGE